MFITKELLEAKRACEDQLDLFNELFPEGVELTRALILEHAQEFDWGWCAENLLPNDSAWEAYVIANASAWKAYYVAFEKAQEAYELAVIQAKEAYYVAIEKAQEAYELAVIQAKEAHNVARATAFADALGL